MKTQIALAALVGIFSVSLARAQDAMQPVTTADSTSALPAQAAPAFSGRVNDVVTLVQSGVDQSVVLSYIKTSPGPFNPDASEIVKVRDAGVPPTVINAMLQRGNELRQQDTQTTQVATATTAAPPTTQVIVASATPSYVQPVYVAPPAPASTVVYIGGNSSYTAYQRLSPYWSFPRPVYSYNTYHYGYGYGFCAPRVVRYGGWSHGGFGGCRY